MNSLVGLLSEDAECIDDNTNDDIDHNVKHDVLEDLIEEKQWQSMLRCVLSTIGWIISNEEPTYSSIRLEGLIECCQKAIQQGFASATVFFVVLDVSPHGEAVF